MRHHSLQRINDTLVLPPHGSGVHWQDDGVTAPPEWPCMAVSEVKSTGTETTQCPKPAIVELEGIMPDGKGQLLLCGGHFARHRAGRPLRLMSGTSG